MSVQVEASAPLDREKICPLLLRCFWKDGEGNVAADYKDCGHGTVPANEIQIYTWADATLRELSDLVKDVIAQALRVSQFSLTFALVYPDSEGRFVLRSVSIRPLLIAAIPLMSQYIFGCNIPY
jgi:histone deacetylase complex subunit SAP18